MAGPVHSMTGVGLAAGATELGATLVELRSLNGRTLAIKQRLPVEAQGFDVAIEARIRKQLARGTVTVSVAVPDPVRREDRILDVEWARRVAERLRELQRELGLAGELDLPTLLGVPGVLEPAARERIPAGTELPEQLDALLGEALTGLRRARAAEGAEVVGTMLAQLDRLAQDLAAIRQRAPQLAHDHRARLLERVNEFLAGRALALGPDDVIKEVALYAERIDVNEELQRIGMHIARVRGLLQQGGEVGRPLEFLLQELLREVNTTGSKAPDAEITHRIVAMKAALDRLKEQAANLE